MSFWLALGSSFQVFPNLVSMYSCLDACYKAFTARPCYSARYLLYNDRVLASTTSRSAVNAEVTDGKRVDKMYTDSTPVIQTLKPYLGTLRGNTSPSQFLSKMAAGAKLLRKTAFAYAARTSRHSISSTIILTTSQPCLPALAALNSPVSRECFTSLLQRRRPQVCRQWFRDICSRSGTSDSIEDTQA